MHTMNRKHLAGKTILITGASSGIGKATAIACAQAGMRVALAARGLEALEQTAAQINAMQTAGGGQAIVIPCNVCDDQSVQLLFEQTLEAFGKLDVMFANAGYGLYASIEDTTDHQLRDMFETNFYGTVRCVRQALPIMRQQNRGHILICSSACSEISLPMYGYYAATKAAQDSLAGALRAELTSTHIKVSSVHPIGTYTDFFNQVAVKAGKESVGLNTPDAMMQKPEHVAKCILKCIANPRNPKPEVWPHLPTRIGVALCTAFPGLAARALRKMHQRKAD
jgi:short-subunit dehydrogenase